MQQSELKQVILVRSDLRLAKGKLAVQAAHASVECVLKCPARKVSEWRSQGMKKVVLKVSDQRELESLTRLAAKSKITCCRIRDAGLTAVPPGTVTCAGLGPENSAALDKITGHLKMV